MSVELADLAPLLLVPFVFDCLRSFRVALVAKDEVLRPVLHTSARFSLRVPVLFFFYPRVV